MDSLQGVEFFSGILIPGWVNAHGHLELSYLKGAIPAGAGLAGFVRQVAEKRHCTPESDRIRAADLQQSRMQAEGVAAFGDTCNDAFTFPLRQKSAICYHNFIELFGIDPSKADPAMNRGRAIAADSAAFGLAASLTPHSTYSVSPPLFDAIVAENDAHAPLSIHFMESRAEAELFRGKGLFAERYRVDGHVEVITDFTAFGSPTARLIASIPADIPLLLIHNTFVGEEDIERIEDHFADVTWVLCPRSNTFIEGAFPPVGLLRRKGCRIALGTDSLASNTSLSLLDELKFLTTRMPELPLTEMLLWATHHGARALGLDPLLGSFEVGTAPGAVWIDPIDWAKMALTPESTARRIV
jgi:cytosine/adenosine deaminase-related metal-dependent hydrolase